MKQILTLLIGAVWFAQATATHIVGGVMSVEHLTGNRYKLSVKLFRDCLNGEAPFDNPAPVGLFSKKTDELIQVYNVPLVSQQTLSFAGASCNNSLPAGCTDMGLYELTIQLDATFADEPEGYYLSYQRCCRNDIIRNVRDPGEDGIAIYAEIPSPKFYINSTPKMSENPNVLMCQDKLTTYNFGFKDADGDILKYSMTDPIRGNLTKTNPQNPTPESGPYPLISWQAGFSTNNQILGTPSLSINATTGEITVNPSQSGTYVIAIRAEEFRASKKIGEVILELQFNVAQCFQPAPTLSVTDSIQEVVTNKVLWIETPNSACYTLSIEDATDSIFVEIQNTSSDTTVFPLPVFERKISGFKKVTTQVCWEAACSLPRNATQTLQVTITDNGCPKFARVNYNVKFNTIPYPNYNPTDLLCMTLADDKETTIYWGDSTPFTPYFKQYNLYRRIDDQPFVLIDSIEDKRTRSYTDTNTPNYSMHNYQYMMRAVNQCGNIGLSSDTLGTFEQLKFVPDKQLLIFVSVFDNKRLGITWPKTWEKDFAQYFVYKKEASDPVYKLIYQTADINDTSFSDWNVDVAKASYCYHVIMKDTCDNYGPVGYEACSILLDGKAGSFENQLSWTQYDGWCEGVSHYDLVSRGDKESGLHTYVVAETDSSFADNQLDRNSGMFSYYVVAHQQDPSNVSYGGKNVPAMFYNASSTSNRIDFIQKPYLFVPNAFTPNDDQLNDTWNIRDIFIKDYKLSIYDKWGQAIFITTDKNEQWTGKLSSGAYAPADVYIYMITYTGYDNSSQTIKGNVTILR
jgi:gliding motility-associated-like protein